MGIGEAVLGLPTGIFTIALGFCLSWWISSFLLGGLDSAAEMGSGASGIGRGLGRVSSRGASGGAASSGTSAGRTSQGGRSGRAIPGAKSGVKSGGALRRFFARTQTTNAAVPASLRWTVTAGIAWSISLIGSLIVAAFEPTRAVRIALLVSVGLGALLIGRAAGARFSHLVAPIFITPEAPVRSDLVGSHARIRSLEITANAGEAKVIDGKSSGAIVRVRSTETQRIFRQGDVVQLIHYHEDSGTYRIDDAEPDLLDDRHK